MSVDYYTCDRKGRIVLPTAFLGAATHVRIVQIVGRLAAVYHEPEYQEALRLGGEPWRLHYLTLSERVRVEPATNRVLLPWFLRKTCDWKPGDTLCLADHSDPWSLSCLRIMREDQWDSQMQLLEAAALMDVGAMAAWHPEIKASTVRARTLTR